MNSFELPPPDADGKYRWEFRTGTVRLPKPTGRWIAQDDGSLAMEMTDEITRDGNGVEISRRAQKPFMTMTYDQFKPEPGQAFTEDELWAAAEQGLRTDGRRLFARMIEKLRAWVG